MCAKVPRMTPSSVVLPDLDRLDSQSLRALVIQKHALVLEKNAELESKQSELESHQNEIERLKLFIAKLQRMQFGPSSERLAQHIDQLELQLEDLETTKTAKPFPVVAHSQSLRHSLHESH
jgi:transposase